MIPDHSSTLTSSITAQLANERDHSADNVTVPDALFLDDHAARHLGSSVSKHRDGYSLLIRLAKKAVICVQLRDDQFFWSLPEMRVAFSSSSNAVAAPRSEWQVCHVVFINLGPGYCGLAKGPVAKNSTSIAYVPFVSCMSIFLPELTFSM